MSFNHMLQDTDTTSTRPVRSATGLLTLPIAAVILCALLLPWRGGPEAALPDAQNSLLQFAAADHVLGFQQDGLYIAGGDHMLHVGFAGSTGAEPVFGGGSLTNGGESRPLDTVAYTDLWPGVSLIYDKTPAGIVQSTWRISQGSDPGQIRLHYNAPLVIASDGSLRIDLPTGWMRESAPVAWQQVDGQRQSIDVSFQLLEATENRALVGFRLGHYDPALPLLIDPVLTWNTFMGSPSRDDHGHAVAVDNSGNVYVAGSSRATWGSPKNAYSGSWDAFAAKFNSQGKRLWHTFLGSVSFDQGYAVAVDSDGNSYLSGYSYATWGAPVNPHTGGNIRDAFAAKLNSNGGLVWNTFMGSAAVDDEGRAIGVDAAGNVYVAGRSGGTWGGSPIVDHTPGAADAFAAKLNVNGGLVWNTFMGSALEDSGHALALDGSGNVYLAGRSIATWGSPKIAHAGDFDAFAVKLNSAGTRLWHTFMGSAAEDDANAIAVDIGGNVYLAGRSLNTWGAPVNAFAGASDAFVAKFNSAGDRQWHTFMGSPVADWGNGMSLDGDGNLLLAGSSDATWGAPLAAYSGGSDAFAAGMDTDGNLLWHTFAGSASNDTGNDIATGSSGTIYVTGSSSSSWGNPLVPYTGAWDAFLAGSGKGACRFFVIRSADGKLLTVCL